MVIKFQKYLFWHSFIFLEENGGTEEGMSSMQTSNYEQQHIVPFGYSSSMAQVFSYHSLFFVFFIYRNKIFCLSVSVSYIPINIITE